MTEIERVPHPDPYYFDALDRQLSHVRAAEEKLRAIAPVLVFNVTATAVAISFVPLTPVNLGLIALALASIFVAMGNFYYGLVPRIVKSDPSLIFFGDVAQLSAEDFRTRTLNQTAEEIRRDVLNQIWINARISRQRYRKVRMMTIAGFACLAIIFALAIVNMEAFLTGIGGFDI